MSFVGLASATGIVIDLTIPNPPAGIVAGDQLLAIVFMDTTAAATISNTAGAMTFLFKETGASYGLTDLAVTACFLKTAGAAESGPYTFHQTDGVPRRSCAFILAYRAVSLAAPTLGPGNRDGLNTAIPPQTVSLTDYSTIPRNANSLSNLLQPIWIAGRTFGNTAPTLTPGPLTQRGPVLAQSDGTFTSYLAVADRKIPSGNIPLLGVGDGVTLTFGGTDNQFSGMHASINQLGILSSPGFGLGQHPFGP